MEMLLHPLSHPVLDVTMTSVLVPLLLVHQQLNAASLAALHPQEPDISLLDLLHQGAVLPMEGKTITALSSLVEESLIHVRR